MHMYLLVVMFGLCLPKLAIAEVITAPPAQRLIYAPLVVRGHVAEKEGDVATVHVLEALKGELDLDTIELHDYPRSHETPGIMLQKGTDVLLFLMYIDENATITKQVRQSDRFGDWKFIGVKLIEYAPVYYAVGEDGAVNLGESPRWLPMARATLGLLNEDEGDDAQARAYLLGQLRQFEQLTAEEQRFALSVLIGRPGEPGELIDVPPRVVMSVLDSSRRAESAVVRRQAVTTAAALHGAAPDERRSDLLPYLADALDDDDVQVRMGAIRALQWIRDGEMTDEGRRGYDPYIQPRDQREPVARWREWARWRAER